MKKNTQRYTQLQRIYLYLMMDKGLDVRDAAAQNILSLTKRMSELRQLGVYFTKMKVGSSILYYINNDQWEANTARFRIQDISAKYIAPKYIAPKDETRW